jgi:hypothetical protein
MPLCPNHWRDSQRNDGVTAGHHAPTSAVKTLLGEWKDLKGKSSSEGEGPVEGVLPVVAPEPGLLEVVQPAVSPEPV